MCFTARPDWQRGKLFTPAGIKITLFSNSGETSPVDVVNRLKGYCGVFDHWRHCTCKYSSWQHSNPDRRYFLFTVLGFYQVNIHSFSSFLSHLTLVSSPLFCVTSSAKQTFLQRQNYFWIRLNTFSSSLILNLSSAPPRLLEITFIYYTFVFPVIISHS